jgi:hypothetical protein
MAINREISFILVCGYCLVFKNSDLFFVFAGCFDISHKNYIKKCDTVEFKEVTLQDKRKG